jgi:hypothetical protein
MRYIYTQHPCLLYQNEDGLAIAGLQTDDTLLLANDIFVTIEEEKLHEAGFAAKD